MYKCQLVHSANEAALSFTPTIAFSAPMESNGEVEGKLSARELEVAGLVAHGLTNRQIADDLGISKTTVDRHVSNILSKRGFASRAQLAAWLARNEQR